MHFFIKMLSINKYDNLTTPLNSETIFLFLLLLNEFLVKENYLFTFFCYALFQYFYVLSIRAKKKNFSIKFCFSFVFKKRNSFVFDTNIFVHKSVNHFFVVRVCFNKNF